MKNSGERSAISGMALDAVSGGANGFDPFAVLVGVAGGVIAGLDPQTPAPSTHYPQSHEDAYDPYGGYDGHGDGQAHYHVEGPSYSVSPTTPGHEYGYENFHF
jgi:hypothetical protein